MPLQTKRTIFFYFWFFLLLLGPFTVVTNSQLERVFSNDLLTINLFQRVLGLMAFTLLFSQIMLGSLMKKWIKLLGGWSYKFHVTEGIFTYGVVLLHPFMQMIIDFKVQGIFGAVLTLLPGRDMYLNFGKIAFVLVTLGFLAGYFRTKPFFRRNWKKFHILSYFAFYFVTYHAWAVGTDARTPPFVFLFWFAVTGVSLAATSRLYSVLKSTFKSANGEKATQDK